MHQINGRHFYGTVRVRNGEYAALAPQPPRISDPERPAGYGDAARAAIAAHRAEIQRKLAYERKRAVDH